MAVEGGGLDRGMPHEVLDRRHANAQFVLSRGKGSPPGVTARINARYAVNGLDPRGECDRAHMLARSGARDHGRCIGHVL